MDKILIVGIGNSGRNIVKQMEKMNIPHAEYVSFGNYEGENDGSSIPHHNLIAMNGKTAVSADSGPEVFKELAENAKDEIKEILASHLDTRKDPAI